MDDIIHHITDVAQKGNLVITNKNKAEQMPATIGIQPSEVSRIISLAKAMLSQDAQGVKYSLPSISLVKKIDQKRTTGGVVPSDHNGRGSLTTSSSIDTVPQGNERVKYSLTIKHTDGSVEELADARSLTNEQAIGYLQQAKSGVLRGETYIPVRKDTPQVIIDTLAQVNENVENRSLVMQVRKAQQAMRLGNKGNRDGKHGRNIRGHALSAEQIVEILNNLDNPSMVIHQTNRHDMDGNPLPDNVAVIVEYGVNGTEGVAVIEFDSSIDPASIGAEFGDTSFHTVVTVFEPDAERHGFAFDYAEELLSNPDNIELEIKRRQPNESATRAKQPNTSEELPSFRDSIAQEGQKVKYSLSDSDGRQLSKEQTAYFRDSKVRDENGSLMVMYHGTPNGDFTVFRDGTYFTPNKEYADTYQNPGASSISTGKTASNPKTFAVYLDIKKPFDISDPEARAIYIEEYIKGGNAAGINPYLSDAEYDKITSIDWTEGEDLRDFLTENGYDYDGLVLDEGATGGYGDEVKSRGVSYVVFSPEQVKNTDNLTPSSDPDIRYSLRDLEIERTFIDYADTESASLAIDEKVADLISHGKTVALSPDSTLNYLVGTDWEDKKAVRILLRSILEPNLGVSVQFEHNGNIAKAYLTKAGINHSVGGTASPQKAAAFEMFNALVKNAEYTFSSPNDTHSKASKEIEGEIDWDTFVSVATLDGEVFPVVFKIRSIDSDIRSQIYQIAIKKETGFSHGDGSQKILTNAHPNYGTSPVSGDNVTRSGGNVNYPRYSLSEEGIAPDTHGTPMRELALETAEIAPVGDLQSEITKTAAQGDAIPFLEDDDEDAVGEAPVQEEVCQIKPQAMAIAISADSIMRRIPERISLTKRSRRALVRQIPGIRVMILPSSSSKDTMI